jgi:hypothetical protein
MRYISIFLDGRFSIIGMVFLLAACSMSMSDVVSPLLEHHAEAPPPEPAPPYRRLIANQLSELFAASSEVSNARVSSLRKIDSSSSAVWMACLKAEMKSSDGSMVPRTYVVLIQRGQITDRRTANSSDRCEEEKYERLSPG